MLPVVDLFTQFLFSSSLMMYLETLASSGTNTGAATFRMPHFHAAK
jgi:hypothetical protein